MRTTVTLDDDVVQRAKALANHQNRTLGDVLSELARIGLDKPRQKGRRREGILLLPERPGPMVTTEMVNALRDDEF